MVFQAQRWLPNRTLVVVGDSAFSALEWWPALAQRGITVVTRLRWEAALSEPAALRLPGTNGRPRQKAKRLPTWRHILNDQTTAWRRLTVPGWYGESDPVVEICTRTAGWDNTGFPPGPPRWGLIPDPTPPVHPPALLGTDLTPTPLTIVS